MTASPLKVTLPKRLDIGTLDIFLDTFFKDRWNPIPFLEIDLSNCSFIEPASLLLLIAVFTDRKRKQLQTRFVLPQSKNISSKKIRDFMRTWQFPQGIEEATREKFFRIVRPEDSQYFGENKTEKDNFYSGKLISSQGGIARLASDRFFSIYTLRFQRNDQKQRLSMVESETKRWEPIKDVMTNILGKPGEYIPSGIIYECMSNAARHPDADFVQTTSFNQKDIHFAITFWDNGTSMIDTLKEGINTQNKNIRPLTFPDLDFNMLVRTFDEEGKMRKEIINTGGNITTKITDSHIFLATTFPGVTSNPSGHIANKRRSEDDIHPGMGLFVLLDTAVNIFGGSVAFRSQEYFMNIRRPMKKEIKSCKGRDIRYTVKIMRRHMPFLGNHITIRLPISKKTHTKKK